MGTQGFPLQGVPFSTLHKSTALARHSPGKFVMETPKSILPSQPHRGLAGPRPGPLPLP